MSHAHVTTPLNTTWPASGQRPLTTAISAISELTNIERHELYALLREHFDGVTPRQFSRDLGEKNLVLRIHRGDALVGFSTLQSYATKVDGTAINVIYSGDTIVDPSAWGSPALARGWIGMVRRAQRGRTHEPWYWLLLSSGFRTYRFLPVFWREFWPRFDTATPLHMTRLMSVLSRERFGNVFDEYLGIVRFANPQRLRGALAHVPPSRQRDPHVAYFLTRNAQHASGDELVCLTRIADDNLTPAGRRIVRSIEL